MLNSEKEYRIYKLGGSMTSFHIIGRIIIPKSNFKLAEAWYTAGELTPESKKIIDEIYNYFGNEI